MSKASTERARVWNRTHPERAREHQRRYYLGKKYGVTLADYAAMLERQGGACAVCGSINPGIWKDFPVDHNHETGKRRGLLCSFCNTGIGQFRDNPELLRAAAIYLEEAARAHAA